MLVMKQCYRYTQFVLIVLLLSVESDHFRLGLQWAETACTPATASPREQTFIHCSAKKEYKNHECMTYTKPLVKVLDVSFKRECGLWSEFTCGCLCPRNILTLFSHVISLRSREEVLPRALFLHQICVKSTTNNELIQEVVYISLQNKISLFLVCELVFTVLTVKTKLMQHLNP